MDIHRDFREVAISEDGKLRSAGRIRASVEQLERFGQSLAADDVVALEATGGAEVIVELLEPHVAAVLVANTRKLPQISRAKAQTDRLEARTLARLLRPGCWKRCGRRPRRSGRCGGRAPAARAWCAREIRSKTRRMPCSPATCAAGRRSAIALARPAASGSPVWSCRSTSD